MTKKEDFLAKIQANQIQGNDILLLLDVFEEISHENEEFIEILEDLKEEEENFTLNFQVDGLQANLKIFDGVLTTEKKLVDDPTVTIIMNEDTAIKILKGKLSMIDAYKSENLKIEGNMMKLAAIGLLLNILSDEIGII